MPKSFSTIVTAALFLAVTVPAFAAGMDMPMGATKPATMSAVASYRFELVGPPKSAGSGKSTVAIRLVHIADRKPISGAIFIQTRADMGPIGMAEMTAPLRALGEQPAGTYRFEIQNGSLWKKADNWALSFAVKIQGEPQTVRGSVIVKLAP
jgi:hypothetical protein